MLKLNHSVVSLGLTYQESVMPSSIWTSINWEIVDFDMLIWLVGHGKLETWENVDPHWCFDISDLFVWWFFLRYVPLASIVGARVS